MFAGAVVVACVGGNQDWSTTHSRFIRHLVTAKGGNALMDELVPSFGWHNAGVHQLTVARFSKLGGIPGYFIGTEDLWTPSQGWTLAYGTPSLVILGIHARSPTVDCGAILAHHLAQCTLSARDAGIAARVLLLDGCDAEAARAREVLRRHGVPAECIARWSPAQLSQELDVFLARAHPVD